MELRHETAYDYHGNALYQGGGMNRIISAIFLCMLSANLFAGEGGLGGGLGDHLFSQGLCPVWDVESKKTGYIDINGNWAIKPQFAWATPFSEGLGLAGVGGVNNSLNVFIDTKGNTVFDLSAYKFAYEGISEGLIPIRISDTGNACGFLDKAGKLVFKLAANTLWGFSGGLAGFWADGNMNFGYLDKTGAVAISPLLFAYGYGFSDDVAFAENKKYEMLIIDKKGNTIANMGQDIKIIPQAANGKYCQGFLNNQAIISRKIDKAVVYELIDKSGKVVKTLAPAGAYTVIFYSEGLLGVYYSQRDEKGESKGGYLDLDGKEMLKPAYSMVGPFSNDLAAVMQNGKIGFIDKKGKIVIPFKFELEPFEGGM